MRINWERLLSVAFIAGTMYLALSVVGAMIPYEEAPRVESAANGTTVYVVQSLREAALWPVGIVVFWILVAVTQVVVFRRNRSVGSKEQLGSLGWLGWTLVGCIVLPFVAVTIGAVIVTPYSDYRKATVGRDQITLSSLYRSWTIPLSDLEDVKVLRDEQVKADERRVDLGIVVTTRDKRHFRSVKVYGLRRQDRLLERYDAVFTSFENRVRKAMGPKA